MSTKVYSQVSAFIVFDLLALIVVIVVPIVSSLLILLQKQNSNYSGLIWMISSFTHLAYSLTVMALFVAKTFTTNAQSMNAALWTAAKCFLALSAGLSALSKSEEEEERDQFNRRFASKFFHANSAFVL
jgi:hypothetical protein